MADAVFSYRTHTATAKKAAKAHGMAHFCGIGLVRKWIKSSLEDRTAYTVCSRELAQELIAPRLPESVTKGLAGEALRHKQRAQDDETPFWYSHPDLWTEPEVQEL